MNRKIGRSAFGLRAPIIREGDSIKDVAVGVLLDCGIPINDKDILCITESVVARSSGLYATVDEIAKDVREKYVDETGRFDRLTLWWPVYSRNRFAICLKGIARALDYGGKITLIMSEKDEVGNKLVNQVTGVNIVDYYTKIINNEGVDVEIKCFTNKYKEYDPKYAKHAINHLVCPVRDNEEIMDWIQGIKGDLAYKCYSLGDILSDKSEWGLYGANKSSEEKVKLFPPRDLCMEVINGVESDILRETGKTIYAMVYGDGCFLDFNSQINECLDPTPSPGYNPILENMPSEVKIKNLADDKYKDLSGDKLDEALRKEAKEAGDTSGKMISLGCTPRNLYALISTLADQMSGSGSVGTPFILLQGYFDNYSDD